jgi:hypothetical protein
VVSFWERTRKPRLLIQRLIPQNVPKVVDVSAGRFFQ